VNSGLKAAFMEQHPSSTAFSSRPPRLLIVEKNFSAIEPLIRTFGDKRLDVDFDVSASHQGAAALLLASPYQLVISGAHLTEMDDFFLLKRVQALELFVPVVVTADASEKEAACRILTRGAFDLIPTPLDHEQAVRTIRLGLWQGKLRNLIVRKEEALEQYRQHMTEYPDDKYELEQAFNKTLLAFEKTMSSVAQTMMRIEESTVSFSDFATKVEYHARKRALERLDALPLGPSPLDTAP
jgi:DNA-binding NtrC family response regulator